MLGVPPKAWSLIRSALLLLAICWYFRLDLVIQGDVVVGAVGVDSDQYLECVNTLLGRHLSYGSQITVFTPGTLTRTPGYPLFLIPVALLSDFVGSFAQNLILAHAMAWLGAVLVFMRTVGRDLGPQKGLMVFLIAGLLIRPFAFQLMSDWLAIMVASIACCCFWTFIQNTRRSTFSISLFSASCAALVRPDYVILVVMVMVGGAIVSRRQPGIHKSRFRFIPLATLAGLSPIAALLVWNTWRLGAPEFIPREGHLYELVSILGPEPRLDLDGPGQTLLNARQGLPRQVSNANLLEMFTLNPQSLSSIALNNLGILEAARARSGISWPEANRALANISRVYIETYPGRYAFAVLCGISPLLWGLPAYLIIISTFRKRDCSQSLYGVFVALFHVLHLCGVSTVHIVHARYYLPSASLLVVGALACVLSKGLSTKAGYIQNSRYSVSSPNV